MNKRKKIAFVIPALHAGGMERVMSELVNYSSKKEDLDVHLLIYGKDRDVFYALPDNITIHKPTFIFDNLYRSYNTIRTMCYIRSVVKRIKPDTILSFGELWNSLVLLALIGLKYPVFISDRCQPDKQFRFFQNVLRQWLYPRATGIVAQTEKAKQIYRGSNLNNNIVVIGNPIREIKGTPPKKTKAKIVVSVGRLIYSKNFDRLIEIFARINNPDWILIIVGGDALQQRNSLLLQKQIEQAGLQKHVFLEGNQRAVEEYLLQSQIFAFTSSSEGFPNVIGEAMSAGLPVVAYDCVAGPSEMIEDGVNGYLVPLFDDEIFETKLKSLMENEHERIRMGSYARESIKKFSVDIIGEQYYKFLFGEN